MPRDKHKCSSTQGGTELRAQMKYTMLFIAAEQKESILPTQKAITQFSSLICHSCEGTVSPGRAPGRPGKHGDYKKGHVGHVSQGQGKEFRTSLGMS